MNIKDAKEQIKNAIVAYFTKDEYGEYRIATEDQRPVFLMGPPGIGKTAIMQQIASELGVGLVSYSMTHHTIRPGPSVYHDKDVRRKGIQRVGVYDVRDHRVGIRHDGGDRC